VGFRVFNTRLRLSDGRGGVLDAAERAPGNPVARQALARGAGRTVGPTRAKLYAQARGPPGSTPSRGRGADVIGVTPEELTSPPAALRRAGWRVAGVLAGPPPAGYVSCTAGRALGVAAGRRPPRGVDRRCGRPTGRLDLGRVHRALDRERGGGRAVRAAKTRGGYAAALDEVAAPIARTCR